MKRKLCASIDIKVGKGTTIVSPVGNISGTCIIGEKCWVNRGFTIHGNGSVVIGDCCDIAPEVAFLTGGHEIASHDRRAGKGESYKICVGDGCWIGARTTVLGNTSIGSGSVVASCSCINKDVESNVLVAGVPAKLKRRLLDGED